MRDAGAVFFAFGGFVACASMAAAAADRPAAALPAGLSTFGLLLTGRLSLRNELLSAISVHTKSPFASREAKREHEVWEER